MKPIHHAMVSARLFGGIPQDYIKLHNAFDLSKAALADMRHRAALHSVDHGGAVMEMVFANHTWAHTTTKDLCIQHVNDDQGFDARLDDWLFSCQVPSMFEQRPALPKFQAFLDAPEEACAARWGGVAQDYAPLCRYFALPESVSDHPLAPAVSRNAFGIYFSEAIFGPYLTITHQGKTRMVPTRDIGETLTMARYHKIPNLIDVFARMSKQDWMMGSRVKSSREMRCASAKRTDLFDTDFTYAD